MTTSWNLCKGTISLKSQTLLSIFFLVFLLLWEYWLEPVSFFFILRKVVRPRIILISRSSHQLDWHFWPVPHQLSLDPIAGGGQPVEKANEGNKCWVSPTCSQTCCSQDPTPAKLIFQTNIQLHSFYGAFLVGWSRSRSDIVTKADGKGGRQPQGKY